MNASDYPRATMRFHGLRLSPGHDLLKEIERFVARRDFPFALVVSAVGSLSVARIRPAVPAGVDVEVIELDSELEIVSLTGVLTRGARSSSHLHIAVADTHGDMTGGHLKGGCLVRLGAKIVLAETAEVEFDQPEQEP